MVLLSPTMTPPSDPSLPDLRGLLSSAVWGSGSTIRGVGFWAAILLPLCYLPLVVLGHPWVVDVTNFTKVVALHVASLFVGRGHAGDAE